MCEQMKHETHGAFDISVGAHTHGDPRPALAPLDPSGLVKGWALERAVDRLVGAGVSRLCINAGGDVVVRGSAPDEPWRIGIQHPWQRDKVADVLFVTSGAVATSGRSERGDHVIDPRCGYPARGLVSATVVGPDLAIADALATAAIAYGSIAPPWLADRADTASLAITDAGDVVTSHRLDAYRSAQRDLSTRVHRRSTCDTATATGG